MKILIYSINFAPELTSTGKYTGEFAEWLSAREHDVKVITAPPYYPEWRIVPPYSGFAYRRDGKEVIRCPIWVPSKPSGLKRIIHLASFAISSFPVLLAQIRWRPDVVWVVEPTLFCAPGALLTAKLSGSLSWLHVQDFEVDAAFALGLLKSDWLKKLVERAESWMMQYFDHVSTISRNMLRRIERKQISAAKASLFPNWVDTDAIKPLDVPSSFRKDLGISEGEIVALYSGNMGNKQGLEIVVAVAQLLQKRDDLRFVLCGDGPGRGSLVAAAVGLPNVHFLTLQPVEKMNDLLNLADIHLLPQKADVADLVMPSKLTGMLASGRPVVATAKRGTQLAEVIDGKGIVVDPGDAEALANAIGALADDSLLRGKMGAAAREYALAKLGKQAILTEFERSLLDLVSERHPGKERL